ncbi:hypothetical protein GUITHDRAFT_104629 [Guillardia theta CCMP2712]|uniref:RWP-RK domain-containing protein n=1 Tax=Guillardia theta (strain CCMP2712) TaxID=905079 RepID=L1JM49_GUITC|nr:hypothetical protein GUITHDRAFT_104629 [Guillardia theta CCMP2712]EKX49666.1 hypothetical protein GUITHDRAFT_104629 [Guillardia theta CCMP2712]|eukprot:XP_005836646.1 hypothetical protein GUITHDRAFT_104629 [Guillardia theta CCMP2712]
MDLREQTVVVTARPRQQNYVPSGLLIEIDLPSIQSLFHLRQEDAASRLGISLSSLKSACRRLGVHRWPYSRFTCSPKEKDNGQNASTPTSLPSDEGNANVAVHELKEESDPAMQLKRENDHEKSAFGSYDMMELDTWPECQTNNSTCGYNVAWICDLSNPEVLHWIEHYTSLEDMRI